MRSSLCVVAMLVFCVTCQIEGARAQQGSYSSKSVYGMFGPRVLGQTLQSPVKRSDRGIARDAYGDFVGVNQAYSGRMFGGPKPAGPGPAATPAAPSQLPIQPALPVAEPQAPDVQPRPDQWLRSQDEDGDAAPAESILPDSSWRTSPNTPARSARNASVVGFPSRSSASDPFAQRITAIIQRTPQVRKLSPIRVDMNGGVATLRGRVATVQDRDLAENLTRLEPGVSDVRNELTVGSPR